MDAIKALGMALLSGLGGIPADEETVDDRAEAPSERAIVGVVLVPILALLIALAVCSQSS